MIKNLPVNAEDTRDTGSIPGSRRSPEGKMEIHSSILAWEIPWTEEPGGLQSMGCKESDTTEHTHTLIILVIKNSCIYRNSLQHN